jgi:hypothetical protein
MFLPMMATIWQTTLSGPQGGPVIRLYYGGEIAYLAPIEVAKSLMGDDLLVFIWCFLLTIANAGFLAACGGALIGWRGTNQQFVMACSAIGISSGLAATVLILGQRGGPEIIFKLGYWLWIAAPVILFILETPRSTWAEWFRPFPPLPVKENNPR